MSDASGLFAEFNLQTELGKRMFSVLPEGATVIVLECSVLSTTKVAFLDYCKKDGTVDSLAPGDFFRDKLIESLREAMYRPGTGTWFSMKMTVTADGAMDADFNYDTEPDFSLGGVDPVAYVNDAKTFPRDIEHQPEWLRLRLAEGESRINRSVR